MMLHALTMSFGVVHLCRQPPIIVVANAPSPQLERSVLVDDTLHLAVEHLGVVVG